MNCKECHQQLMDYFDHNRESKGLQLLHSHLDSCQGCRELFDELTVILGTLEATSMVEPESGLEKKVMKRIQSLPVLVKQGDDGLSKMFMGSLSVIFTLILLISTPILNHISFLDMLIHGRSFIYRLSGIVLDCQIIYHFVSGLFSTFLFSLLQQIQSVYTIALFMTVFLGVKAVYGKLAVVKNGSI